MASLRSVAAAAGPRRALARTVGILAPVLFAGGCATGRIQPTADTGKVTVGVTTTGLAASPATFRLTIEPAGLASDVRADVGVFTNDRVPNGEHAARLQVPANCQVDKGPERTFTISPQRRSAVLRFEVRCS
jgi:hypothetical protein